MIASGGLFSNRRLDPIAYNARIRNDMHVRNVDRKDCMLIVDAFIR